ncbi:MAG TPA: hypothetical protein VF980_00130 [Thermoanaerobaculia bacterium]
MKTIPNKTNPLVVFIAAIIFFLIGAGLGNRARRPAPIDQQIVKAIENLEQRMTALEKAAKDFVE